MHSFITGILSRKTFKVKRYDLIHICSEVKKKNTFLLQKNSTLCGILFLKHSAYYLNDYLAHGI